jgi:hypothetical protein
MEGSEVPVEGIAEDRLYYLLVRGLVASLSLSLADGMICFPFGQLAFRVGH